MNFGAGDKPKLIYVKSVSRKPRTDVVAFRNNRDLRDVDFALDIKTMQKKCVDMKIEHILDTAGLTVEGIMVKHVTLDKF